MRVVEVGQYLVTKDTGNLRQFRSVACIGSHNQFSTLQIWN